MEITLKIVLSADASFVSALQGLFANVQGTPVSQNGEEKTTRTRKPKEEKAPADNAPLTVVVEETKAAETELTLEYIRGIAVPLSKKSGANKDAIKAKTSELGYESIAFLEPKDFEKMYQFLQTLS